MDACSSEHVLRCARDIFAVMNKPKLIYFDAPVGRGEECRLALHLAGIDFEDVRIKGADWPAMKEQTLYGALPVLELPGRPPLAHSNAILVMIGRAHGLHPSDEFVAARHEGMMQHLVLPKRRFRKQRNLLCPGDGRRGL